MWIEIITQALDHTIIGMAVIILIILLSFITVIITKKNFYKFKNVPLLEYTKLHDTHII